MRIHCFNNKDNNTECVDLELSYYVECETIEQIGHKGASVFCQSDGETSFIHKWNLLTRLSNFEAQSCRKLHLKVIFSENNVVNPVDDKAVLILSEFDNFILDYDGNANLVNTLFLTDMQFTFKVIHTEILISNLTIMLNHYMDAVLR